MRFAELEFSERLVRFGVEMFVETVTPLALEFEVTVRLCRVAVSSGRVFTLTNPADCETVAGFCNVSCASVALTNALPRAWTSRALLILNVPVVI